MIWLVWYEQSSLLIHLANKFSCSLQPGPRFFPRSNVEEQEQKWDSSTFSHTITRWDKKGKTGAKGKLISWESFLSPSFHTVASHFLSIHPFILLNVLLRFFLFFLLLSSSSFLSTVVFSQRSNVYSQAITTLKISCNYPRIPRY